MINYITSPFKWFFKLESASGLVLLISAIIALIISNSSLSSLYFNTLDHDSMDCHWVKKLVEGIIIYKKQNFCEFGWF